MVTYAKISPKSGEPQRYSWGTQKKKKRKEQIEIVYNLPIVPQTVSNTYTKVARTQPCVNHVPHIRRSSCATCPVPRGTKGQFSYSFWHSLNHIYFSFIVLAERLTYEGEKETGLPRENPYDKLQILDNNEHLLKG